MKYTKLKSCVLLLMLSACGGGFDEHKNSMVISSGPYRVHHEQEKNVVSRLLTGDGKDTGTMYLATGFRFSKQDGSGEWLSFGFKVGTPYTPKDNSYNYGMEYASPGDYALESYQIGYTNIGGEYNSAKCGKIEFTVYPNEVVYIGGIKPDPKTDIANTLYKHAVPHFEKDAELTLQKVADNIYSKKFQNPMLTKKFAVRIPKNSMPSPPADCLVESKPIWERF